MATKFPDIYYEFLEPLPSTSLPFNEASKYSVNMSCCDGSWVNKNKISVAGHEQEHGNNGKQSVYLKPLSCSWPTCSKHASIFTKSGNNLPSCVASTSIQTSQEMSLTANVPSFQRVDADVNRSEFADLDHILAVLEEMDVNQNSSTSSFLTMTKNTAI